jgi:hypothetical protein
MKALSIATLAIALGSCQRQAASSAPEAKPSLTISGPYTHENLSLFLIHKPGAPVGGDDYLTLEEAFAAGVLRVTEKGEGAVVNELEVENTGDRLIYLQAGDTVKGGRQDRTIAQDTVVGPKSGKMAVSAFCVEPGRWSGRDGSKDYDFRASDAPLATKEQRLAVRLEKNQLKVWEAGTKVMGTLTLELGVAASDSYVLATEDPELRKRVQGFVKVLETLPEGKQDVVGMAFAINGKINSAEIYAATGLFRKLWPKLLKGCAVEALAKKGGTASERVTPGDVRALLEESAKAAEKTEAPSGGVEHGVRLTERVVGFETRRNGRFLRCYWSKLD